MAHIIGKPPRAVLTRLRKLCLSLPHTTETLTWGHPNFRVVGKIFIGFGRQNGRWCVGGKVGKARQRELLRDPRYLYSDYVGRFGWVSLITEGRLDAKALTDLVLTSYRLIAPKSVLVEIDGPEAKTTSRTASRRISKRR